MISNLCNSSASDYFRNLRRFTCTEIFDNRYRAQTGLVGILPVAGSLGYGRRLCDDLNRFQRIGRESRGGKASRAAESREMILRCFMCVVLLEIVLFPAAPVL